MTSLPIHRKTGRSGQLKKLHVSWKSFTVVPICKTCNVACKVQCTVRGENGIRYQKRYCPICKRRVTTEYIVNEPPSDPANQPRSGNQPPE